MPLQQNDVRRHKNPAPAPVSGPIKGVGWKLKRSVNGINLDAHPTGDLTMEEANGKGITVEQMKTRWPEYSKGTDEHSSFYVGILRELRAARKIPGLSPEEHDKYGLEPTAEQVYDAAHSEDGELLAAWHQLSGTQNQFNPADVGLGKRIEKLEERVKAIETKLGSQ